MVWKDNALWKFLLSAFLTNWFSLTRVYDCKILYLIMLRAFTMIPNKERLTLCLISITISCLRSCWELLQWFQIKRTGILFDVNLSSWSSGFFFFFSSFFCDRSLQFSPPTFSHNCLFSLSPVTLKQTQRLILSLHPRSKS